MTLNSEGGTTSGRTKLNTELTEIKIRGGVHEKPDQYQKNIDTLSLSECREFLNEYRNKLLANSDANLWGRDPDGTQLDLEIVTTRVAQLEKRIAVLNLKIANENKSRLRKFVIRSAATLALIGIPGGLITKHHMEDSAEKQKIEQIKTAQTYDEIIKADPNITSIMVTESNLANQIKSEYPTVENVLGTITHKKAILPVTERSITSTAANRNKLARESVIFVPVDDTTIVITEQGPEGQKKQLEEIGNKNGFSFYLREGNVGEITAGTYLGTFDSGIIIDNNLSGLLFDLDSIYGNNSLEYEKKPYSSDGWSVSVFRKINLVKPGQRNGRQSSGE